MRERIRENSLKCAWERQNKQIIEERKKERKKD
jgi:hypothetical protein